MFIFDLHQDLSDSALYLNQTDFFQKHSLHEGQSLFGLPVNNQTDFIRSKKANIKGVFASSCIFDVQNGVVIPHPKPVDETFRHLDYYQKLVVSHPKQIQIIYEAEDLSSFEQFDLSLLLHIEGAAILEEDIKLLDMIHEIGVRSIGLTWNYTNKFAGGAKESGGLTKAGMELIKLMNHKKIILDLAHINEESFFAALKVSQLPPIYTHANCKDLHNHFRNVTDKQLKELSKAGGIMGLSGVANFMGPDASIETLVEHIFHTIDIMGIDQVALGTDFNGMTSANLTKGFEEVTCLPDLLKKLKEKGLTQKEVQKIASGNILRYLNQILV